MSNSTPIYIPPGVLVLRWHCGDCRILKHERAWLYLGLTIIPAITFVLGVCLGQQ